MTQKSFSNLVSISVQYSFKKSLARAGWRRRGRLRHEERQREIEIGLDEQTIVVKWVLDLEIDVKSE